MKKSNLNKNNSIRKNTKLVFKRETIVFLIDTQLQQVVTGVSVVGCTSGDPVCDTL